MPNTYTKSLERVHKSKQLNLELGQQPASGSDLLVSLLIALGQQGHAWLLVWLSHVEIQVFLLFQKSFLPTETPQTSPIFKFVTHQSCIYTNCSLDLQERILYFVVTFMW